MLKKYSFTITIEDFKRSKSFRETVVIDTENSREQAEKEAIDAVLTDKGLGYDALREVKLNNI